MRYSVHAVRPCQLGRNAPRTSPGRRPPARSAHPRGQFLLGRVRLGVLRSPRVPQLPVQKLASPETWNAIHSSGGWNARSSPLNVAGLAVLAAVGWAVGRGRRCGVMVGVRRGWPDHLRLAHDVHRQCRQSLVGIPELRTPDNSRNNVWISLLVPGEGWHNNHHAWAPVGGPRPPVVRTRPGVRDHCPVRLPGLGRKDPASAAEATAADTRLPITDGARQILRAIRGNPRER